MASMTYRVFHGKTELMAFRADFAQASSPIMIVGEDGADPTPFQVADASHRPAAAAKLLNGWLRNQGGEAWSRGTKGLTLRASL